MTTLLVPCCSARPFANTTDKQQLSFGNCLQYEAILNLDLCRRLPARLWGLLRLAAWRSLPMLGHDHLRRNLAVAARSGDGLFTIRFPDIHFGSVSKTRIPPDFEKNNRPDTAGIPKKYRPALGGRRCAPGPPRPRWEPIFRGCHPGGLHSGPGGAEATQARRDRLCSVYRFRNPVAARSRRRYPARSRPTAGRRSHPRFPPPHAPLRQPAHRVGQSCRERSAQVGGPSSVMSRGTVSLKHNSMARPQTPCRGPGVISGSASRLLSCPSWRIGRRISRVRTFRSVPAWPAFSKLSPNGARPHAAGKSPKAGHRAHRVGDRNAAKPGMAESLPP